MSSPPEQNTRPPAPPPVREAVDTKAREYLEGWQRARADYENLSKRLQTELATASESGKEEILRGLFPILDAFETALTALPQEWNEHPWAKGLARIRSALESLLASAGVSTVEETGTPFDASRHEAVGEEPSAHPAGTVMAILARGYHRNGRTLRPAKVKVSSGPKN